MTPSPTLLLVNARVHTLDPARPHASAVAVSGGRIAAVEETVDLRSLAGPGTRVVDCQGKALLPGFHDSHIHILGHAAQLSSVDCSPRVVKSIRDLQEAIRRRASELPSGTWIRATGYHEFALAEKRHPTGWELDAAAPDHPVRLSHQSYHASVLNSFAMKLSGIGMESEEPSGGIIERELETGEPNGLLFETAQELVAHVLPQLTEDELSNGVARASQQYAQWGITALQDATASNTLNDWRTLLRLQQAGHLRQRTTMMLGNDGLAEAIAQGFVLSPEAAHLGESRVEGLVLSQVERLPPGHTEGMLQLGPVKTIVDETTGSIFPHPEVLKEQVLLAHRAGFQVTLHCLTPETLDAALDAIQYAQQTFPRLDARHRIEHCSVCTLEQARQIRALGVTVSTQPPFVYYNGDRYLSEVPMDQQPWLYPLRTLLDAGVTVAAGSDCPVVQANPFAGMFAAVTRRSEGGQVLGGHQAVSMEEALRMYTVGAAAAALLERELGTIAPGKRADLVLLSDDPMAILPEGLLELRALLTIIDGEVVWEA